MTILERIELCQRYHEGCEIGEAIDGLLCAAYTLNGLGDHHKAQLTLVIVEMLIKEDIEYYAEYESDHYNSIDLELKRYILNG